MLLGNIISGGQTGVDRAALDASIAATKRIIVARTGA